MHVEARFWAALARFFQEKKKKIKKILSAGRLVPTRPASILPSSLALPATVGSSGDGWPGEPHLTTISQIVAAVHGFILV